MKNIVLLMLDTVRASDVYHNQQLHTLNGIMKGGTAYTNAIAPGTWTAPTHASLFTNKKVTELKQVSRDFFMGGNIDPWMVKTKFLDGGTKTIAERLSKYGYNSALFSNNPFLTSHTNLARGFDRVFDMWLDSNIKYNRPLADRLSFIINGGAPTREKMYKVSYLLTRMLPPSMLDFTYRRLRDRLNQGVSNADGTFRLDRGAADTNSELKNYLTYQCDSRPNFIFINYLEAHENYPIDRDTKQDKWLYLSGMEELSEGVARSLHRGYLRRLRYLDRQVRSTIEILKERGMLDDASLIITSDHGQLFGEKGLLYHSLPPYQNEVRVPLIAANYKNGRMIKARDRSDTPVSLLSLHDAILGLASGREEYLNGNLRMDRYVISEHTGISEGWDEHLLRLLKSRSKSASKIYEAKSRLNMPATAVYHGNFKLIHYFGKKEDELYDLASDPYESENIMQRERALSKRLLSGISS